MSCAPVGAAELPSLLLALSVRGLSVSTFGRLVFLDDPEGVDGSGLGSSCSGSGCLDSCEPGWLLVGLDELFDGHR